MDKGGSVPVPHSMQAGLDNVWQWSELFLEVVERWIAAPPEETIAIWDWPTHRIRLNDWRREVLAARERYLRKCPENLRELHEYWRAIAVDDATEQVELACETITNSSVC